MMWDYGWHMGGMLIWWLLGLVFIVGLIWLLVAAAGRRNVPAGPDSAEVILRERWARGDIDDDEYKRKLRELRR